MSYKLGDVDSLPQNTKVRFTYGITPMEGEVVGKVEGLLQSHIIKCTCGYIPNEMYRYDTLIVPLTSIILI